MAREREVSRLFTSLADTLVGDYEVTDLLQRLVDGARSVLVVDAVGVLLGREGEPLGLSAASDEDMHTLEVFELQAKTGPCFEAYTTGETVAVEELETAGERWPGFVPRALELGFRSAYAFPLRLRGDTIGGLNAFRREVSPFDQDDMALGQSLADMATIGILHQRAVTDAETRAAQLQGALDSRVMIEQAKGMLAERLEVSPGEAFDRLRAHSRNHHVRLRELCRRVIEEDFRPE